MNKKNEFQSTKEGTQKTDSAVKLLMLKKKNIIFL